MKFKDVKEGVRVVLKVDHPDIPDILPKGTTGSILESGDVLPYVQWDVSANLALHNAGGYVERATCFSVPIKYIKRVK